MGVLSVLNHQVLKVLVGSSDLRVAPPFTGVVFSEGQQFYTIGLPENQATWMAWVPVLLAVLLWLASYFRVTEKQL